MKFIELAKERYSVRSYTGQKIEKFGRRTNFSSVHGVNRLRDIMHKMGISHELRRMGAENYSRVQIGSDIFQLIDSNWQE